MGSGGRGGSGAPVRARRGFVASDACAVCFPIVLSESGRCFRTSRGACSGSGRGRGGAGGGNGVPLVVSFLLALGLGGGRGGLMIVAAL